MQEDWVLDPKTVKTREVALEIQVGETVTCSNRNSPINVTTMHCCGPKCIARNDFYTVWYF